MKRSRSPLRSLLGGIAVASFGMAASVVQAAPITEWSFTVETLFTASAFTAGSGSQTTEDQRLSWGQTGATEPWDIVAPATGSRSGLEIVDVAGGTITTNSGTPAPTASITHFNFPIDSAFATLDAAQIQSTLTLTPTNPALPQLPPDTITFDIDFIETLNSTPCGFPTATVCDDIFVIAFGALNNSFTIGDFTYFVSVVTTEGVITPLPASTCATAGVAAGCLGFTTPEGGATTVDFGILITTRPINIPEPAGLALLGVGLLGMAYGRRRKIAA